MSERNKYYFASDFHLGVPTVGDSLKRERKIIRWLDLVSKDAKCIYLVGDVFDFWYEYKTVVPKGYIRLLGKLAELKDRGIEIHFFTGNHDMWMFRYLQDELQIPIHREPIKQTIGNKKLIIGHGDGLGPGDYGYKFIKKVFANPFCIWLFGWLHPDIGMKMANYWSKRSRIATGTSDEKFLGEDQEWLVSYCKDFLKKEKADLFVFGHRHLPLDISLPGNSRYINLGDWIKYFTYLEFDGDQANLKTFEE